MDKQFWTGVGVAAAVLFTPIGLIPFAAAGGGAYLLFKKLKGVKFTPANDKSDSKILNWIKGLYRTKFEPGKGNNARSYQYFRRSSSFTNDQMQANEADHYRKTFYASWNSAGTGFIPKSVDKNLDVLNVKVRKPGSAGKVTILHYDYFNKLTGCAEIVVDPPYDQEIKLARGGSVTEKCDRVAVKLNKRGEVDWSMPENKALFKNPEAVAGVLRSYPESFATIPVDILAKQCSTRQNGSVLTLGDYFITEMKMDLLNKLNPNHRNFRSIGDRRLDGTQRTMTEQADDIVKMIGSKVLEYNKAYGKTTTFNHTTMNSFGAPSTNNDEYFPE